MQRRCRARMVRRKKLCLCGRRLEGTCPWKGRWILCAAPRQHVEVLLEP